jgi:hypothetical protein
MTLCSHARLLVLGFDVPVELPLGSQVLPLFMCRDKAAPPAQFIDLCILLGCDYCGSIRGIGPHRALQLIKQHRNIETILENLDTKKVQRPVNRRLARDSISGHPIIRAQGLELPVYQ